MEITIKLRLRDGYWHAVLSQRGELLAQTYAGRSIDEVMRDLWIRVADEITWGYRVTRSEILDRRSKQAPVDVRGWEWLDR